MDWLMKKARDFNNRINSNLQATRKLIRVDELTELIDLYETYQIDHAYNAGDVFKHDGKLYKVIQAHTSQTDWIPSVTLALYLSLMPKDVIPEWRQPTGAHDAYSIGDKVIFNGQVYESLIDGNTWSPSAYPQGWKIYAV